MRKHTLFIKAACGITAAALVLGAVGVATYNTQQVPGVVEAEEKATGHKTDKVSDAKALENAVTSAVSQAQGSDSEIQKEETVFVFADEAGKAKQTVVSDWLKNSEDKNLISDNSSLTGIENVKGDEDFTQNGTNLTWDADGNDIYYQGTTDAKTPVGVKVTYKLDGKEISADKIAGKSGKVTIRFDYTNEATTMVDGEETMVPFTMITGVLLPTDNFKNVSVSGGKVISEGDNSIALGYAFPGLGEAINVDQLEKDAKEATGEKSDIDIPESLEIEADATDFSLDMTMTVALPGVLSDVVDTDDSKLGDLESALNDLDTGIEELTDGTQALADGAVQLKDGTSQLSAGSSRLYSGAAELSGGAADLKNIGTQVLADGAATLDSNSSALNTGASQLSDGASQVASGASALADGADTLDSAINNADVNNSLELLYAGSDQVAGGISEYANGVASYMDSVNASSANLAAGLTGIAQNEATVIGTAATVVGQTDLVPAASDSLGQIIEKGNGVNYALGVAVSQYTEAGNAEMAGLLGGYQNEVAAAVSSLSTIQAIQAGQTLTPEQQAQIQQLANATAAFKSDDTSVNNVLNYTNGVKALVDNFKSIQSAAAQLSSGASRLSEGAGSLSTGAASLKDGVGSYTAGVNSLSTGAATINDNMGKLSSGAAILTAGLAELDNGAGTLNTGAVALSDGATQLDTGVGELADGVEGMDLSTSITNLRRVIISGKNYDNFSGKADGEASSVKFIIKTDGVKAD